MANPGAPPAPGNGGPPPPPPPPRALSPDLRARVEVGNHVDALVGTIFFWFGVLFAVVLIGIPFLLMGHAARKRGRAAAEGKLDVLANGVASQGRVTHLENVQPIHDRGRAANVSASWRIHFEHVVQGRVFAGASALTALRPDGFAPGMPVWIVRDPADPTRAEIWPPVT